LEDDAVKAAVEALAAMEPARLSWGLGVAKFVMNRRQFTERGIILGTNPRGLADRSVPLLRVGDVRGKLRAVVFQAASHNTTLTGKNLAISGDYAGFAQAWVERMYPGVQAMFMIGCAADANPYPRGTPELARRHGSTLGEEVCRLLESKLKPVRGPIHTELRRVDLPLESFTRQRIEQIRKQGPGSLGFFAGHALARLDRLAPIHLDGFGVSRVEHPGEEACDATRSSVTRAPATFPRIDSAADWGGTGKSSPETENAIHEVALRLKECKIVPLMFNRLVDLLRSSVEAVRKQERILLDICVEAGSLIEFNVSVTVL
jgi:hypothetical protein